MRPQGVRRPREGVLRHVDAQQLLLPGQLLGAGLVRLLQARASRWAGRLLEQVEEGGLARLPLASAPLGQVMSRSRLASSVPRVAQAVQGAGLDHALQRPLVELAEVHPLAEVLDGGERPALVARR